MDGRRSLDFRRNEFGKEQRFQVAAGFTECANLEALTLRYVTRSGGHPVNEIIRF